MASNWALIFSCLISQVGEDSCVDYDLDSSSDASSDYEVEKHKKTAKEQQALHRLNTDVPIRMGGLSIHDEHPLLQEGFSSDDGEAGNSRGALLFEFLEQDAPYGREPLADKASLLFCCSMFWLVYYCLI